MNNNEQWIIVNSTNDYPEKTYDKNHAIYLCVTKNGKTVACKFRGGYRWESTNNWKDTIVPIAYQRVTLPEIVIKTIQTSKQPVEYLDGLITKQKRGKDYV